MSQGIAEITLGSIDICVEENELRGLVIRFSDRMDGYDLHLSREELVQLHALLGEFAATVERAK